MATPPKKRLTRIANLAASSEQEKPLVCKNVSEPGKRYRMVCE
jgi:hypothetical protein